MTQERSDKVQETFRGCNTQKYVCTVEWCGAGEGEERHTDFAYRRRITEKGLHSVAYLYSSSPPVWKLMMIIIEKKQHYLV